MHTIKITPNLLLEYQYKLTSGKFIRLPNRKIDSVAKIESNLFSRNWNALACNTDQSRVGLYIVGQHGNSVLCQKGYRRA